MHSGPARTFLPYVSHRKALLISPRSTVLQLQVARFSYCRSLARGWALSDSWVARVTAAAGQFDQATLAALPTRFGVYIAKEERSGPLDASTIDNLAS